MIEHHRILETCEVPADATKEQHQEAMQSLIDKAKSRVEALEADGWEVVPMTFEARAVALCPACEIRYVGSYSVVASLVREKPTRGREFL